MSLGNLGGIVYMFETIIFEKAGGVARITLNRPQVLNAINRALLTELDQALDDIENDSTPSYQASKRGLKRLGRRSSLNFPGVNT